MDNDMSIIDDDNSMSDDAYLLAADDHQQHRPLPLPQTNDIIAYCYMELKQRSMFPQAHPPPSPISRSLPPPPPVTLAI